MDKESVLVFLLDVSPLEDETLFREAYAKVDKKRQEKIDKFRFGADKRRSLGAGILLMEAASFYGINPKETKIGQNEYGKPYFCDYKDVDFSLSHSGKYAVCAIGTGPLGCDIEKIKDANLNIAKRFFSEKEYEYLKDLEDKEERNRSFFRLWTLKESYIKAIGEGLKHPLNDLVFKMPAEENYYCEEAAFFFHNTVLEEGYSLSVAMGQKARVRVINKDCSDMLLKNSIRIL